jgi:hypothetical protein
MGQLILKRANTSRPSGHWSEDDYDVLTEGEVVGGNCRLFYRSARAARI